MIIYDQEDDCYILSTFTRIFVIRKLLKVIAYIDNIIDSTFFYFML